ncbi:MAG TPA: hypothetical protein VFF72_07140 [Caldimonas sp.]|nr:hypothetical protein [Caldimonas sp.]
MYFALQDGGELGLNVGRFDERQWRLRLRLAKTANCWDYAPLIDVVFREPGFEVARFTGKTVSQWLANWQAWDNPHCERFMAWYEGLINRFLSVLARRPRVPDDRYGFEVAPLPWISSLSAMLRASGPNRATAQQWSAAIRATTEKGVRSEELALSGVLARLQQCPNDAKLTKTQVLRLVDLSHALPKLVCESRFEFATRAGWRECCDRVSAREFRRRGLSSVAHGLAHIRFRHRSLGWSIARTRFKDLLMNERDSWIVLDEKGRLVGASKTAFASSDAAMEFAELQISCRFASWSKPQAAARWECFSLPGGDDYRELLIQLDDWPATYRPRHYRTRNVLSHVRSSMRQVVDGRRVLFLDEIQSDWHADLHAQSKRATLESDGKVTDAPYKKEWPLLTMKIMLWLAQRCGAQGLAWSTAELQEIRWLGHEPPGLLYRNTLPDAARMLAKTLPVTMDATRMRVRTGSRTVALGSMGWEVRRRQGSPITKPFRTRIQAESFADQTGDFVVLDVPVLWLDRLTPITSIPLFGARTASGWTSAPMFESTRGDARTHQPPERPMPASI